MLFRTGVVKTWRIVCYFGQALLNMENGVLFRTGVVKTWRMVCYFGQVLLKHGEWCVISDRCC